MKFLYFLLIVIIVFHTSPNCIYAQSVNTDSLLLTLQPKTQSEIYVRKQIAVIEQIRERNTLDSLIASATSIAEILQLYKLKAEVQFTPFRIKQRLKYTEEELDQIMAIKQVIINLDPNHILHTQILERLAKHHRSNSQHDSSVYYLEQAVDIAERENYEGVLADLYFQAGYSYMRNEQVYFGINSFLKSMSYYEEPPYRIISNLPNAYRRIEDWDKVLEYGQIGLNMSRDAGRRKGEVFALFQIGVAHVFNGKHQKAKRTLEEAWNKTYDYNIPGRRPLILSHLMENEILQNDMDGVLEYAIRFDTMKTNLLYHSAKAKIGLAHFYKENYNQALSYCNDVKASLDGGILVDYDKNQYVMESCNCLYLIHQKLGNDKLALENLELYNKAKAYVEGKETVFKVGKAVNQLELAQQQKIHELEEDTLELKFKQKENLFKIIGISGTLLLLMATFWTFQYRKWFKVKDKLNQELAVALSDKEILLREIHHRVKNNLQLVSSLLGIQSRGIKDSKAKEAINEGRSRVHSMSLIHHDLYRKDNLTGVEMQNYLPKLASDLFETYNIHGKHITLSTDIDDIKLDVETVIPIGLIVNELITNALKYAFPNAIAGELIVSLKEINNMLLLIVKDNGIGLDQNQLEQKEKSFGHSLIKAFKTKLGAEIKIGSFEGTSISIYIKNYKKA